MEVFTELNKKKNEKQNRFVIVVVVLQSFLHLHIVCVSQPYKSSTFAAPFNNFNCCYLSHNPKKM